MARRVLLVDDDEGFLLAAGREVARLLDNHLGRLEGILNRISPVQGEAH